MPLLFFLAYFAALVVFIALNLLAVCAFGVGFIILVTLWLRRKAEFWPLLLAMTFFFGGAGALGGAWGAFYGASELWPDSVWPFWGWIGGYILGGTVGVLLGAFGVAWERRRELPRVATDLKMRFRALQTQFATLGFRQTLRLGSWSLRLALSRKRSLS